MPGAPHPVADLRELIASARARLGEEQRRLREAYEQKGSAPAYLRGRARLVDAVLREIWSRLAMPKDVALVAVGGYGRGELYPASDIDILFLVPDSEEGTERKRLEPLIGLLWDIGLDIGHSVRSVEECLSEAEKDISVQTTLLESRRLCGSRKRVEDLMQRMREQLDPPTFLKAKQLEQAERYGRYNDTPYSLEPNSKESPGGLRDLQVILWIAQAARLGDNWRALAGMLLVTADESRQLTRAETFLRHTRIRLHLLAGRREDRLLFEHQEALAKSFGLAPTPTRRASEVFMQRYYRNAKLVTQLNTLVLLNLGSRIIPWTPAFPVYIDGRFQAVRDLLDVVDVRLFEREPRAIIETFVHLAKRSELRGMTARALRALWQARHHAGTMLRKDPASRQLFLSLFQQKRGLTHEIRRMNQYDILGQYLPAFGRIVGQMQHDLFHVYTVDQHILQVIRYLRRFAIPEYAHEFPFCSQLMSGLENPSLLYVAALFHDIAKGRGGDHSRLGMVDARRFCREHGIVKDDAETVVFLVGHHLTMSQVAQKQDLADPDVIHKFAAIVRTQERLTALYLLTVADIRGTSPKVWNAWKGKLLEDLFRATSRLLRGDAPLQIAGVAERQEEARRLLRLRGLRPDTEEALWGNLDTSYFLRHDSDEIVWHTRALYYRPDGPDPVVRARLNPFGDGMQVMVYIHDQPELFTRICGFFARLGYSIAEAKVHTTRHGYALDSFVLLDPGERLGYRDVLGLVEHDLVDHLKTLPPLEAPPPARLSRQVRHFPIAPEVVIRPDERGSHHVMSVTAADRPGLLYSIARTLSQHGIDIRSAKIATLGERVEDTFLISGQELGKMATLVHLEQELLEALQV